MQPMLPLYSGLAPVIMAAGMVQVDLQEVDARAPSFAGSWFGAVVCARRPVTA